MYVGEECGVGIGGRSLSKRSQSRVASLEGAYLQSQSDCAELMCGCEVNVVLMKLEVDGLRMQRHLHRYWIGLLILRYVIWLPMTALLGAAIA